MVRKNAKKVKTPAASSTTKEVVNAKNEAKKEELAPPAEAGAYGWILKLLAVGVAVAVTYYMRQLDEMKLVRAAHYISRNDVMEHLRFNITCDPMLVRWLQHCDC